jgi:hypothetical protein
MAFPRPAAVGFAVGLPVIAAMLGVTGPAPGPTPRGSDPNPSWLSRVEIAFYDALDREWAPLKRMWTNEPRPSMPRLDDGQFKRTIDMVSRQGVGLDGDPLSPTKYGAILKGMGSGLDGDPSSPTKYGAILKGMGSGLDGDPSSPAKYGAILKGMGSGLDGDPSKSTSGMLSGLRFGRYAELDADNHVVAIKLAPTPHTVSIPPDVHVEVGWKYVHVTGKFVAPDSLAKDTQGHQLPTTPQSPQ